MHLSSIELQNLRLLEIERILNRNGRSLWNYHSMPVSSVQVVVHATNQLIIDELDYDMTHEISKFESLVRGLNSDQYHVFILVLDTHHRDEGDCFSYMVAVAWENLIYGIL